MVVRAKANRKLSEYRDGLILAASPPATYENPLSKIPDEMMAGIEKSCEQMYDVFKVRAEDAVRRKLYDFLSAD